MAIILTFCLGVFFSAEQILSRLKHKKSSRGVRGRAPQENFENLHAVIPILELYD